MMGLTKYYVLGASTDSVRFYAVFTFDEYNLIKGSWHDIEWVGEADSVKTVAESWLNQKEFSNTTEEAYLDSFD
jgi:hypothetical protein